MENGIENEEFNGFLALHLVQLQASGVPEVKFRICYFAETSKLSHSLIDLLGKSFQQTEK